MDVDVIIMNDRRSTTGIVSHFSNGIFIYFRIHNLIHIKNVQNVCVLSIQYRYATELYTSKCVTPWVIFSSGILLMRSHIVVQRNRGLCRTSFNRNRKCRMIN